MGATRSSKGQAKATLGELPFDLAPAELGRRAEGRLERARRSVEAVVAARGPRTVATVLAPINAALAEVRDAGSHGSLLFAVHTDPAARKAGREVSEAADQFVHAFRLNERVYAALKAIDLEREDPATSDRPPPSDDYPHRTV